jgi:hypothetical protein
LAKYSVKKLEKKRLVIPRVNPRERGLIGGTLRFAINQKGSERL